jgi:ATP-dependent Clp protease ATP-binding subunit ClpA
MRGPAGRSPQLPVDLLRAVTSRARELGRDVVTNEFFLLGLLELAEPVIARRALEAEGLSFDRVVADLRTRADAKSESPHGLMFPPAYNEVLGRAQGFAATLGDGTITPEHVLLALIWDPANGASQLLWRLGLPRERVVERLRQMGAAIPVAPIPEQCEIEAGERIWFDRTHAQRVVSYVGKRIPPGTFWGFNYADDRAWIIGESTVDMGALVDEALT